MILSTPLNVMASDSYDEIEHHFVDAVYDPDDFTSGNEKVSDTKVYYLSTQSITTTIEITEDNYAMDFDGNDDYAEVENLSAYITNSSISMSGWVYPTSQNNDQE